MNDCRLANAAPTQAITALRERLPLLPSDYFEFLERHDGGEGSLGIDPGWFQLWSAENAAVVRRIAYTPQQPEVHRIRTIML